MALFQNLRWIHDVRQVGTGPLWGETRDRRLVGSRLLLSLRSPAQHSLVELSPAGSRLPLGLSGPDWSSPPWRAAVLTAPWMGGSRGSLARTAGSALRYPARGQRRPAAHAPGAVPWQLESFPPTGRAENGSEGVAGPGPPQGGLSGRAGG